MAKRNFPERSAGRSLQFEMLEDRRVLALPHAVDGFSQGLLHTEADFQRMADKVAQQAQPWYAGWQALLGEGYAQLGADPRPLETVIRGGEDNYAQMHIDIQRAYLLALRWKVTGDTAYADKAVEFLNAWKNTMTNLTGNSNVALAAGIYGYQWANVAEIMRTYDGWAASDASEFGDWLALHFAQKNSAFLAGHYGTNITHYWANWDMCNIAALMAIGIYNDDQAMYDEAIDYLHNGEGNGALDRFVYYVHDGNLGQFQESGRDQGHTTLGVALGGAITQMAWNQGDDLFGYDNNRFAATVEYISKYNLGEDVPFEQFAWEPEPWNDTAYQNEISPAGRGTFRPGWELVHNHYANVKGIELPWTEQVITDVYGDVEGWSRNGDQFGFGTLTYTLDDYPEAESKPSGLTVVNFEDTIKLNWWGAVYADSHNVYRATSEAGAYTQIASGITDLQTYTDFGIPAGEYFYKVTGVIDGSETADSEVVQIDTSPALIAHLQFDETMGTTAADATGSGVEGTLQNGATWTAGNTGNAVDLSASSQYVSLPEDVTEDLSDFTIATWVKLDNVSTWSRVFDFGDSNGRYMFLTPRAGSGNVRFAIATNYRHNEDILEGTTALPTNQWVHIAVSLSGRTGRLYVNGVLVDSNTAMNLNPAQVGGTSQNWIGRSQYTADPYLNGKIDDFRIYNGALSAGTIYQLANDTPAPAVPAAPTGLISAPSPGNRITLAWTSSPGASGYTIKRGTQMGGPYFTIATQHSTNNYVNTGLAAGTTYYYVVTADNTGGQSTTSEETSATALPPLPGAPTNLVASSISASEIQLSWQAGSSAESYNILRDSTSGGPYSQLVTGVTETQFVDSDVSTGETYYYVVTSVNASGESGNSVEAAATVSDLSVWLKLDETSGALAADASGNGGDGALVGEPLWIAGKIDNAVALDGTDDYVDLPDGVISALTDFTIATWVYLDSSSNWSRIFDFGTGTAANMFLTPQNGGSGTLRYAITTSGGGAEQQINTSMQIPLGTWMHVAVTQSDDVGVLYVNGTLAGFNRNLTLTPSALGLTTQNYLGKSQYPDAYLDGRLDDFRIYNRALNPTEVNQLASVPDLIGDYDADGQVNGADFLAWQRQLNQTVAIYDQADGDGNARIDHRDLPVWAKNYGMSAALLVADSKSSIEENDDAIGAALASYLVSASSVSTIAVRIEESTSAVLLGTRLWATPQSEAELPGEDGKSTTASHDSGFELFAIEEKVTEHLEMQLQHSEDSLQLVFDQWLE